MSNFAEFEVPEEGTQDAQPENSKSKEPESKPELKKSVKSNKSASTSLLPNILSGLFTLVGIVAALAFISITYARFSADFTYPYQNEVTQYTYTAWIVAFVSLEISRRNKTFLGFIARITRFAFFAASIVWVGILIYGWVTNGNWWTF